MRFPSVPSRFLIVALAGLAFASHAQRGALAVESEQPAAVESEQPAAVESEQPAAVESEQPASPPGDAANDVAVLIEAIRTADPARRRALVANLSAAGPDALAAVRAASDAASAADVKAAYGRAATWILAGVMAKTLAAGLESQLTFDGQYVELRKHGSDGVEALLTLIDDETAPFGIRLASCRALADVGDAAILPRLGRLYHDALLLPQLREELGIVAAVFGNTEAVDADLRRAARFASSPFVPVRLEAHIELANLNYRIRNYGSAVGSYEEILKVARELYQAQKRNGAPPEALKRLEQNMALHYYNAACSNSLHGRFDRAREYLRKAVEAEPMHFENIEKDGDLTKLREQADYKSFRAELGKLFEGKSL